MAYSFFFYVNSSNNIVRCSVHYLCRLNCLVLLFCCCCFAGPGGWGVCVCVGVGWGVGGIYFSLCFTFATDMKRFQTIVVSCLPDLKKEKKKKELCLNPRFGNIFKWVSLVETSDVVCPMSSFCPVTSLSCIICIFLGLSSH